MSTTTLSQSSAPTLARWRWIAFYIPVALFSILLIVFTGILIPALPYLVTGWFIPESSTVHHAHEFMSSIFFWSLLVGAGAQFFRPTRKAAPVLQLSVAILLLVVIALATSSFIPPFAIFLLLTALIVGFHPAGVRTLLQREGEIHQPLLGLAIIAVIPAVSYAIDHIGLQGMHMIGDEHAEFFHWGVSAVIALCTVLFGIIAALRFSGWKITGVFAGLIGLVFGVTSLAFPEQASAIGTVWGSLAVLWGLSVISVTLFVPARLHLKR